MTETHVTTEAGRTLNLRVGEWVEVRPIPEIIATLDVNGALDGLPFMPEMVQYSGKCFRVFKSAHKTCDTIELSVIRRMDNAVHLEGLRCTGEAHGGCQASCLLFWKEAWLKRVTAPVSGPRGAGTAAGRTGDDSAFVEVLQVHTRQPARPDDNVERFRCQATDLLKATHEIRKRDRFDPRTYVKDVTSGNVSIREFVFYGLLAMINAFTRTWFNRRYPSLRGLGGDKTPAVELNLQPGELVQVRSKMEILTTLNSRLRNRGLLFDYEMVPYCDNGTYRVLRRVERIINEKTGKMMTFSNACLILDGVACGGKLSSCRMFCPRSIYQYWHEVWLKRASPEAGAPADL
jgi:hypothetical protein